MMIHCMAIETAIPTARGVEMYKELVHAFYDGEQHTVRPEEWCEERVMHLVSHVRTSFGQAFLLVEAGCPIVRIHDSYLSPKRERRDFQGLGILHRDHKKTAKATKIHVLQPLLVQESAYHDPSGVGIMSEVLPKDGVPPQDSLLMTLQKNDIPAPPLSSEFRAGWEMNQNHYPIVRAAMLDAITETRKRIQKTWSIFARTKLHLQNVLLDQQETLRSVDDAHAFLDAEYAELLLLGENERTPTLEYVREMYAEIQETADELEKQLT